MSWRDERASLAEHAAELGVDPRRVDQVARFSVDVDGRVVSGLRWSGVLAPPLVPPLVLLHGGGQNAHTWDALLLQRSSPAVAIDLPGHGRSSWIEGSAYLPRELAPMVAAAVASITPTPLAVVGASLGGLTALRLASLRPDLVPRLVIVDVSPASTSERAADVAEFVGQDTYPSLDAMVEHVAAFRPGVARGPLRRSVGYNAAERADGSWSWSHDQPRAADDPRWARIYADLARYWDDVATLRCPTMLVVGGRSTIVTDDDVARYRDLVPGLRVEVVAGAGHSVQGSAPLVLADLLTDFVRST